MLVEFETLNRNVPRAALGEIIKETAGGISPLSVVVKVRLVLWVDVSAGV